MDGYTGTARMEQRGAAAAAPTRLRVDLTFPPRLVMIGASTGGPQALIELLTHLVPALPYVPVCVTLHMPPDLVPVIAAHVSRKCGIETKVVTERCPLDRGFVHFASGNRYMTFSRSGSSVEVAPALGIPRDFCKPAIDTMFVSGAAMIGARSLGIVLSGMGTDGLVGARAITAAGGVVLVQDKATSAVWGMPGAVAKANLAAVVLPPAGIAAEVLRRVRIEGHHP